MESNLKLADLFQDHMMFQAKKPLVFFGQISKNGILTIELLSEVHTFALEHGYFTVSIANHWDSFNPFSIKLTFIEEVKEINDCLLGDLYVVSGQSNAQMMLKETSFKTPIDEPMIRFYEVPKLPYVDAQKEFPYFYFYQPKWTSCTEKSALNFSAIGYHIATELHQTTQRPIGIISCNMGDTSVFSWLDETTIRQDSILSVYAESYDHQWESYASIQAYNEAYHIKLPELMNFYGEIDSNIKAGKTSEEAHAIAFQKYPNPYIPMGPKHYNRPGGCFEMMTKEIIPFAVSGMIYYQGESDHQNVTLYQHALQTLFDRYRVLFKNQNLPIFYIQIANYAYPGVAKDAIALIRQAQQNLCDPLKQQYLISAIDLGEENNIHPTEKVTLSKRITTAILTYRYGCLNDALSPMMKSYRLDHQILSITTTMNLNPLYFRSGKGMGFDYSIDGQTFQPLDTVSLIGRTVTLHLPDKTTIIRYAYKENPVCDLYSENELPYLPFEIRL